MKDYEDFFYKHYNSGVGRCRCKTAALDFHLDVLFSLEVRKLCTPTDWKEFGFVFNLLPKEYRTDLKQMLIVGFGLKEAYETLKETYKF